MWCSLHHSFVMSNPMGMRQNKLFVILLIIGGYSTTFATSNCFNRMKTKACHVRKAAHLLSIILSCNCMCSILDKDQCRTTIDIGQRKKKDEG